MNETQLTALKQAIANLKAAVAGQFPAALTFTTSLNLTGQGSYSLTMQAPSTIPNQPNTIVYSGPAAELPAAQ